MYKLIVKNHPIYGNELIISANEYKCLPEGHKELFKCTGPPRLKRMNWVLDPLLADQEEDNDDEDNYDEVEEDYEDGDGGDDVPY